jgi:hypothetical protein
MGINEMALRGGRLGFFVSCKQRIQGYPQGKSFPPPANAESEIPLCLKVCRILFGLWGAFIFLF